MKRHSYLRSSHKSYSATPSLALMENCVNKPSTGGSNQKHTEVFFFSVGGFEFSCAACVESCTSCDHLPEWVLDIASSLW